jgi:hypothetical protein
MQHSFSRVLVRPTRHRGPLCAVHTVESQPRQRITGGYLHPHEPVELPATFAADRVCELAEAQRGIGLFEQAERAEELPHRDAAAGDVLAVVARVIPTA